MNDFIGKYQKASPVDRDVWSGFKGYYVLTYLKYLRKIETIEISREGQFWLIKISNRKNKILTELRFELGKTFYSTPIIAPVSEASLRFTFEESKLIAVETPLPGSFGYGQGALRWVWELEGADLTQTVTYDVDEPQILRLKRI